jgi:hypothetical protein
VNRCAAYDCERPVEAVKTSTAKGADTEPHRSMALLKMRERDVATSCWSPLAGASGAGGIPTLTDGRIARDEIVDLIAESIEREALAPNTILRIYGDLRVLFT